jgi:hypothetical protein
MQLEEDDVLSKISGGKEVMAKEPIKNEMIKSTAGASIVRRNTGKVSLKEGKYFLDIGGKSEELPHKLASDQTALKALVGKEVDVVYSPGNTFITALHPKIPGLKCFMCYVPIDWKHITIDEKVRANLAKEYLDKKLITKETYAKLQ